jgi:hypothetical protein
MLPGFGSEKFFRWHRLSSLGGLPGGRGGPPHKIFYVLRVSHRPMKDCSEKFFVGCVLRTI